MTKFLSSTAIAALFFAMGTQAIAQDTDTASPVPLPLPVTTTVETPVSAPAEVQDPFEETTLEHPDDIVTEAQYAEDYINYMAPPDTENPAADTTREKLQVASDVEVAITLANIERSLKTCQELRETIENKIGDRPGSYSIDKGWVGKYQKCLLQRKTDLDLVGDKLQQRYVSIIEGGGEEGATQLTDFVDKMNTKQSQLILDTVKEIRLQKKLVQYYNTGQKDY